MRIPGRGVVRLVAAVHAAGTVYLRDDTGIRVRVDARGRHSIGAAGVRRGELRGVTAKRRWCEILDVGGNFSDSVVCHVVDNSAVHNVAHYVVVRADLLHTFLNADVGVLLPRINDRDRIRSLIVCAIKGSFQVVRHLGFLLDFDFGLNRQRWRRWASRRVGYDALRVAPCITDHRMIIGRAGIRG